mgnify:CR=1 FL=1
MNLGTRSVLFGVHCFWWHPITVLMAYRKLWARWPSFIELICIAVHDLGYWGSPDIDGPEGRLHSIRSGDLAFRIVYRLYYFLLWFRFGTSCARYFAAGIASEARDIVRYHSRWASCEFGKPISNLCWPDKFSITMEPRWFYLFRARLSGEIWEYTGRACDKPPKEWYVWYLSRLNIEWGESKFCHRQGTSYCDSFISAPIRRIRELSNPDEYR